MKLIILLWAACLVVHVKGDLGVRKIELKNGGRWGGGCGATRAGIFLINRDGERVLWAKHASDFEYDETITWTRACRGNQDDKCFKPYPPYRESPKFDDTFKVQIKTVEGQFFCPVQAQIEVDDGYTYITRFTKPVDGWYSQSTNNIDHEVQVLWTPTPQITCPTNLEDACPVNDMFAYAATVQERRACVFT